MNALEARRRLLMLPTENVINTSPKIAEYGYHLARSATGVTANENWCYTEWYQVAQSARQMIHDNCTNAAHTFQYDTTATSGDFWYGPSRMVTVYSQIRFSIPIASIADSYAYSDLTGQIFFAGRNTPYYGYLNINDMPT